MDVKGMIMTHFSAAFDCRDGRVPHIYLGKDSQPQSQELYVGPPH